MKNYLKIVSYCLLAVFFAVTLTGCGTKAPTDPDALKVKVWSFEDEDAWKPVTKSFASKNKGYTLVYEKQTLDTSYENKILNSILSGQGPDIWAMPNDWVYRHKEKLAPMPDTLAKTYNLDKQFVPAIKQSVYFDNKIYAMSPSAEPLMVYYNSKIFNSTANDINANSKDKEFNKKANNLLNTFPKTWSDFTELTKILTKKNGATVSLSGVAMGTNNISDSADISYLLMMQNETDIISSNYKLATFNLPKDTSTGASDLPGQRAIEFYSSFADPSSANYSWNDSLGNDIAAFGAGRTAMIFGYSGLQNTILQKYPDLKFKKAYAPQISTDSTKITDFARFNAFGVNKLSKNIVPAWNAIDLLINNNDTDFNSYGKLFSSKKASSYDISVTNRESSNPEKLSLATANALVKGKYPLEFDSFIREAIDSVNRGVQTPRNALDLAANNATEILRKDSW